jgi:hypothetical protein
MDGQPRTIRRRKKYDRSCLYIPKGEHRELTEGERAMCLEEFSRWLAGRELYQALADEAAELRRSTYELGEYDRMVEQADRDRRANINAVWLAAINRRQEATL